ncbi:MAG: hypothetical protein PHS37_04455 [Candidatus Omnitrophica bacterium]|nr:hypothetical protein [Candidatus Omnitrophota bacterium]
MHGGRFTDYAHFCGDIWDYQSLAVNMYLGLGYTVGFAPGIDKNTYRFATFPYERKFLIVQSKFIEFQKGLKYDFSRSPGFPVFLALVYKIFGIHPHIMRGIHMAMLGFAIALLPWFGWHYWGKAGLLSGTFSSYIATRFLNYEPYRLLTEVLITFVLALWVIAFILWERKPTRLRTVMIGLMTGLAVFVKASNIFIPFFFVAYMPFRLRRMNLFILRAGIYMVSVAGPLVLWGLYAHSVCGRFVPVSSQFGEVLSYGNNTSVIATGTSQPALPRMTSTFREHDAYKKSMLSAFRKYFFFLKENRGRLLELFMNKLFAAFKPPYDSIVMLMLLYYIAFFLFRIGTVPLFPLIYFFSILILSLFFFGCVRISTPFVFFFTLPAAYCPFYLVRVFMHKWWHPVKSRGSH